MGADLSEFVVDWFCKALNVCEEDSFDSEDLESLGECVEEGEKGCFVVVEEEVVEPVNDKEFFSEEGARRVFDRGKDV